MIILIIIGLVLSLGGGALLSLFIGLPFQDYSLYGLEGFLVTAGFYAVILMIPFMIALLIMAIVKRRAKPQPTDPRVIESLERLELTNQKNAMEMKGSVEDIRRTIESKSVAVLEQEIGSMKELLAATLQEAMETNETVPLLKKMNAEIELSKTNLAVSLKEKNAKLTALFIENEKLEKNNYALKKMIEDAINPYCLERNTEKFDKTADCRADYQGEKKEAELNF
ncbi:MAG: hypothetical protein FWC11_00820 [Firmicutes bacterium]|nr:hypothetical protein [Bacillota bacterium]MCL2255384.1 hypothetical protein [Bacillota bacterium]